MNLAGFIIYLDINSIIGKDRDVYCDKHLF